MSEGQLLCVPDNFPSSEEQAEALPQGMTTAPGLGFSVCGVAGRRCVGGTFPVPTPFPTACRKGREGSGHTS